LYELKILSGMCITSYTLYVQFLFFVASFMWQTSWKAVKTKVTEWSHSRNSLPRMEGVRASFAGSLSAFRFACQEGQRGDWMHKRKNRNTYSITPSDYYSLQTFGGSPIAPSSASKSIHPLFSSFTTLNCSCECVNKWLRVRHTLSKCVNCPLVYFRVKNRSENQNTHESINSHNV